MALTIPSTSEYINSALNLMEQRLGVETPAASRSFLRVLATALGMAERSIAVFARERSRANLAITAQGADLAAIGAEYNVFRRGATAYRAVVTLAAPAGVVVPANTEFYSAATGYKYYTTVAVPAAADASAALTVSAQTPGADYSIDLNGVLTLASPQAGWARIATVTEVVQLGADAENVESYRQRLLAVIRGTTETSVNARNSAVVTTAAGTAHDYRVWAEAVPGVKRAFPFTGTYIGSGNASRPGDRTVYIEPESGATAAQALLNAVKQALTLDPETGLSREILGVVSDNLYVQPMSVKTLNVTIAGLDSANAAAAQTAARDALTAHVAAIRPFVQGLDPASERRDAVAVSDLTAVVQRAVDLYGAARFDSLTFSVAGAARTRYTLANNELLQLENVLWTD
jgi:hypothetical protein